MNEQAMNEALIAILEEAEKLSKHEELPTKVQKGLDLIMSIARYQHDVRSAQEKRNDDMNVV